MSVITQSDTPKKLAKNLLAEKEEELRQADSGNKLRGAFRLAVGTTVGFTTGASVVLGGMFSYGYSLWKHIVNERPDLMKDLDKLSHMDTVPEKEMERMADVLHEVMEHKRGTFGHHLTHNAKSWVTGLTLAGAGAGLLWHVNRQSQKVADIREDVQSLKQIDHSWQHQVNDEKDQALHTQSHAHAAR